MLVNEVIELPDGIRLEVDFHWPAYRLVVETDGFAYHRSPIARRNDAERDARLRAAGLSLLRLTHADVYEYPERSVRAVRAATARAAENVP